MNLTHIPLEQLKLSTLNVRKKGGKDIADLLPSIRSLGLIQPLLVRPNCEGFEIVAGQRRFHALTALAQEGIGEPVPCIVMAEGDDAAAIEASLAENVARLPMDEVDQFHAFADLREKGLSVDAIASRFGVTERLVEQRLALAGIIDPILNAYRRGDLDAGTLRILTMATPRQQRGWWKLFKSEEDYAPTGRSLKEWLFGGAQIPLANALFDPSDYKGAIVSDLFGEDSYFADPQAFWQLQNAAIAAQRDALIASGWSEVVVLDTGQHFATWNHAKTPKKKGGKVFIAITHDGEVSVHEGWLTEKEARRKVKADDLLGDAGAAPPAAGRPELTQPMRNYLGLHKHAAVRVELLAQPKIALRLATAHMIAGSSLWSVEADPQRPDNAGIAESLAGSRAMPAFAKERARVAALLGIEHGEDDQTIVPTRRAWGAGHSLPGLFERLLSMKDAEVMRVLAFVMAETLEAHSAVVEALASLLATDMRNWWSPDQTFFDLMRDKEAINSMVREVAGDPAADAHVASTAKVQKKIIGDCMSGTRESKVENWQPRYMAFPAQGYTGRFAGPAVPASLPVDEEDDGYANFHAAA